MVKQVQNLRMAIGVLMAASAVSAYGQQAVLTGDTQVYSSAANTNYGTGASLTLSSTTSTLLNFDIADVLPGGTTAAQVVKATLTVFPDKVTTAGTAYLYEITGAWNEGTVTYATKPSINTTPVTSTAFSSPRVPATFTVTGLVQGWITSPSANHGFMLKVNGSTNITLDSKENTGTSQPAILQIVLSGPAGATGAVGAAGAEGPAGPAGPVGPKGATGAAGTIPANLTALSGQLSTTQGVAYLGSDKFQYGNSCQIGDTILSVNGYGGGNALPADGRLLPISPYIAIFSLVGTNFGGNGISNFALPDLRAFAPKGLQYSICVFGTFPSEN